MIRTLFAASALMLLAACNQPAATTEEAPAAPQGLYEQVSAMSQENQLVFATTQLATYAAAHPEVVNPPCTAIRGTERINVPANVDPESIYAAHVDHIVITVQCGELRSLTRMDPNQKWLVVFAPGADTISVEHCLGPRDTDRCPRQVPTVVTEATP